MATDIYQSQIGEPTAWKIDGALINFDDNNADLLATSLSIQYNRGLSTQFPINSNRRIIIATTPQGQATIGSIIGPIGDLKSFLDRYGDVCQVNTNTMTLRPAGINPCEDDPNFQNLKFTLSGCLLAGINVTVNNDNGMGLVTSQLSLSFVGLQIENTN